MKVAAALAFLVSGASAFTAPNSFAGRAIQVQQNSKVAQRQTAKLEMSVFTDATTEFANDYPMMAKYGWGPSTKAERWNGRHAMFGWFAIVCTGYCQAHHLIPDADKLLDLKEWGTLATISGKATISNERAIILIAHVHALMVSVCATMAPMMDTLLLEPGEADEPAAGVFPPFETGLTSAAELWNGRMAMMGLITASSYSLMTGTSFLNTVDLWLGGLLFKV
uniref:Uncharacterized protein n=1 Tax=Octactis speculum TaxID=3111310 RepID=A0A7S2MHN0_9STRA|mmetsp:Transcript_62381/g.85747  ORF Transcript_62381/g.85747 Transcript_62381/m.85747 type:complete len:223 (+) Transcript_62381:34-702(+)|eukprot:CAMPEP_0185766830 /NCGR_PEP_ID=MMETSP1174-20130828/39018_1 /TAXON_ID=35687 /ORGANISM="Dictyocha speculum, Strain CCMP1381" /LENGTH=222 /DNA_ID=CAMNT_0028450677 /DNA_START=33 /DNA_END=701 /DNA_ORIENTATION=+